MHTYLTTLFKKQDVITNMLLQRAWLQHCMLSIAASLTKFHYVTTHAVLKKAINIRKHTRTLQTAKATHTNTYSPVSTIYHKL